MRKLGFFVCGTALMAGGLFAAACGTDNGTTTTTVPKADGATPNKGDGSVKGDGGDVTPDDDASTGDDGGADCSNVPKLRDTTKGFRCSFLQADGGAYCANDTTCCNPANAPDGGHYATYCASGTKSSTAVGKVCQDYATKNSLDWPEDPAKPGSEWQCADKNQCGAGQVCCMYTGSQFTAATDKVNIGTDKKNYPAACNALSAYKAGGTHCVTGNQCPAGDKPEIKLCSLSDDNCATGTTCTPFAGFYRDMGYCR
ncbi:hypothetical protein AKJ09_10408 [Labilithrix luteola]|uniref:Uncharacterized protein n=2 Tax=Labilithrix luteola TaxID=1391654 RepID=A0A0K1QEA5_9BACT|nr:hypothetical protein AKJ09_10408 [Labilithrix luteola]